MAFESIAYGPDEACLLTIDGAELLAYDASTGSPRWRLSFSKPLLSVLFVDASALAGLSGGSPFRSQPAARSAVVVDADGRLHAVDVALGQTIGELGPFGKPGALASCSATGAVALAVDEKAFLWRGGERTELPIGARAIAFAFSRDGATLAVGTDRGEVRILSAASSPPQETLRCALRAPVADLAAAPDGSWLAASPRGVFVVEPSGSSQLDKIPPGPKRLRFSGDGRSLAVQTSERGVVVYEWPRLSVLTRIEYTDRPVRGLAFGDGDSLGVGIDHGDGNQIDVVTGSVRRTGTHPGRKERSWKLLVEGTKHTRPASEADDARRTEHAPRWRGAPNAFGRVGIGVMLTMALLGVRVGMRTSSHGTHPYNLSGGFNYKLPSVFGGCDRDCASARLDRLKDECEAMDLGCAEEVSMVQAVFHRGSCAEAREMLTRVSPRADAGAGASFDTQLKLAQTGLADACNGPFALPRPLARHATLVRLKTPGLSMTTERIPEVDFDDGEVPRAVWAAPDGTVFVATSTSSPMGRSSSLVYERTKEGNWRLVYHPPATVEDATFFGRSSTDVYLSAQQMLAHYDGSEWREVTAPTPIADGVARGGDVFLAGGTSAKQVHRRAGDGWIAEPTPPGFTVRSFATGGGSLWALAEDETSDVLLERSPAGSWSRKSLGADAGSRAINAIWVSPAGELFVATEQSVLRSKDKGARWTEDEVDARITAMWGRSGADVYGATNNGLLHWDGKRWSPTSYTEPVTAISGTATEVLVVRTDF